MRGFGAAALLSTALWTSQAAAAEWRFAVYLDDAPIGHYRIDVQEQGDEVRVESEARINVTLLSMPLFRYVHHASERWVDGCLVSLRARTDDNGRARNVDASLQGDRLIVSSERGEDSLSGCVMTYAYWNPKVMQASHLLNLQTGEYQAVRITSMPAQKVTVRGAALDAKRFRIDTGRHDIDILYSPDDKWVGLDTVVRFGRRLRYALE